MFFTDYPRFLETSETTTDPKKLEARYQGLIVANRDIIQGASILDLASHDGRWSFAALKNGAAFAYGIEWKNRLIVKTQENMRAYDVPETSYHFEEGDIFEGVDKIARQIDCIFCFGIFYHINNHMLLLQKLSRLNAKHIIVDTNVSRIQHPVIELKTEGAGSKLIGHPSPAAVKLMLEANGWQVREFDWLASGLLDGVGYKQYESKRRITMIGTRSTS